MWALRPWPTAWALCNCREEPFCDLVKTPSEGDWRDNDAADAERSFFGRLAGECESLMPILVACAVRL